MRNFKSLCKVKQGPPVHIFLFFPLHSWNNNGKIFHFLSNGPGFNPKNNCFSVIIISSPPASQPYLCFLLCLSEMEGFKMTWEENFPPFSRVKKAPSFYFGRECTVRWKKCWKTQNEYVCISIKIMSKSPNVFGL